MVVTIELILLGDSDVLTIFGVDVYDICMVLCTIQLIRHSCFAL